MNKVDVLVKGVQAGVAAIAPYSHEGGLQFYRDVGSPRDLYARYHVPAYEVYVSGKGPFRAIRFALRNHGNGIRPANKRPCDTGLLQHRVCHPTWVPTYSPRSFRGQSRPGAWRLLPGKQFLIHEGPGPERGSIAGSIGCIEILDGKWGHFLWQIEDVAGATCEAIGTSRALTVTLEAAPYPLATLV